MKSRSWTFAALAGYLALAFVLLGLPLLLEGPGAVAGSNGADARLFTWALAWWPHTIGAGIDPLSTDLLYAPEGYDLLWTTSVPGPALVLWPLTAAFGAPVAYSVALVIGPALCAWTAFLLCRELTGRVVPSLAGGLVFGFSSNLLGSFAGGHLHLVWAFLLPVAALLAVRHVRGTLSTRAYVVAFAAVLVAQFSISTEVLLTLVLFGGGLLVAAWAALPDRRPAVRATILATVGAGLAAGVLLSPLLAHVLSSGDRPDVLVESGVIDALNPVFPTELTAVGRASFAEVSQRYTGNPYTRGGYLGVGLLVVIAAWALATWRSRRREERLLLGFLVVAMVLALGPALRVTGLTTVPLPWWPFAHLPLLEYVLTHRFMAYVTLAAGVVVALWLATAGARAVRRGVVVAAGLVLVLPAAGTALYRHEERLPPLFADGGHAEVLRPDDRVFVLPYGPYGPSMAWQRAADFDFALVGGYAEPPPASYELPVLQELGRAERFSPERTEELRAFLESAGATVAVVDAADPGPGLEVLDALGVRSREVGGVHVARLRP